MLLSISLHTAKREKVGTKKREALASLFLVLVRKYKLTFIYFLEA